MGKRKAILLLSLSLFTGLGAGIMSSCSSPTIVRAEVISSDNIKDTESDNIEDKQDIKATIEEYWNQFIAPLFVGVTGTSIVSALLSIGIAIINRKNNKASKEEVSKSHQEVSDVALKASEMISSFKKILNAVETQNEITQEMKKQFVDSSNQLLEKIAALTNKTEDLMKLKQIVVTQANINSKIALASKEVVTSGVGEDIKSLAEQIKQL